MDFQFPEEAEDFRGELRAFTKQELPSWWTNMLAHDDRVMPFTLKFSQKLAKRGWLTAAWPVEYGGQDADVWRQMVIREEMFAAGEPRGPQYMILNYIGPAIMMYGTAEQKERYLKPMAAGEVIWCQGFSEPSGGSDLASLRTRAEDTGSGFRINGQKIWTSYASFADHCLLMARTDPEAQRHKGISMMLVDMKTPGITVRPIDSMAGPVEFNEVFFDDVEVPYDCVLGPVDEGWHVAMSSLARERVGPAFHARTHQQLEELTQLALNTRDSSGRALSDRRDVRAQLTRLKTRNRAAKLMMYHAAAKQAAGENAEVDAAIYKLVTGSCARHAGEYALKLAGIRGQLREDDPWLQMTDSAYTWWVHALPTQITVGSNEIMRNVIAQRGLGLPRR